MPLTVNWASTWANQSSGSAGQKGGILTVTEFVAVDGPGSDSSIVNFVLVGVTNCSGHDWDQREVILFRKIHKMTHNQFHAVVSRPRLAPGTSDATPIMPLLPPPPSPLLPPVHRTLCFRSQSYTVHDGMKGPWNRVYCGLAPGSRPNNMAAVMEVNVSHQIDNLIKSMDFYEKERLMIWK